MAVVTKLESTPTGFRLIRDGMPYFIKGAGGTASKEMLKACGGNSFRLWGANDADTQDKLDEAQRLGLTVTLGLWLRHSHEFDYSNQKAVNEQYEKCKSAVLKYKDHPALLLWGVGNEMEGFKDGADPNVWNAVNQIASFIKSVDPHHPVMSVTAEIGGSRVECLRKYAPSIDIHGINSYGGCASLAKRYAQRGACKMPYILTEFGPKGCWEMPSNDFGIAPELTSTQKTQHYHESYLAAVENQKDARCLGSYAFLWGAKQEATATWFGMFLPDGTRLGVVDTMQELWTGMKMSPANKCPTVEPLKVTQGKTRTLAGQILRVALSAKSPSGKPLSVQWVLDKHSDKESVGGKVQAKPPSFPDAITQADITGATVQLPSYSGAYWLYAFVYDGPPGEPSTGAAVANIPLFVDGSSSGGHPPASNSSAVMAAPPAKPSLPKPALPPKPAYYTVGNSSQLANDKSNNILLTVYADGVNDLPFTPSGWMGNTQGIKFDPNYQTNPHSGSRCARCEFNSTSGWGGVVWQSPANDWGNLPGGHNLTGASRLTFFARGEDGGEVVSFKMGILGKDKPHHDSAHAELPDVHLSTDWQQYSISFTAGTDLSQIKTGFCWVAKAACKPVIFYVDDICYEF